MTFEELKAAGYVFLPPATPRDKYVRVFHKVGDKPAGFVGKRRTMLEAKVLADVHHELGQQREARLAGRS